MYTDFYKLKEKPFNLTPSSRFLYLGDVHKEALALLTYGVVERKGFILLTGEVGTGKTTMIQALLANLDESVQFVLISNPLFSSKDFLNHIGFATFKKKAQFKSKAEFLIEFEGYLKGCRQDQKNFILIIDEAHKLSFELLEEIRLLSNMETADEKLINICLAGQPELNEMLSESRCRSLFQRISVRYHIRSLDMGGTREYVTTRLQIAGAQNGNKLFSNNVIKAIHHYSEGCPRMINILADNALLLGYSRGKQKITASMIRECYHELRPEQPKNKIVRKGGDCVTIKKRPDGSFAGCWNRAWIFFAMLAQKIGISPKDSVKVEEYYLGNAQSNRFHRPGCPVAGKMSLDNQVRLKTRRQAFAEGYSPCKRCKP